MNKKVYEILTKILIIMLFISAIVLFTEMNLRQIQNSYSLKKEYFEMNLDSIELLILGSSEPLNGIDPQFIKIKSFNLSERAQSLYYDKMLIEKYIDHMPKLKFVIISISYFSLWYQLHNFTEDYRDYYYYHFWNIKPDNHKVFALNELSFIALYGTDFSQRAFKSYFNINAVTDVISENGFVGHNEFLEASTSDTMASHVIRYHSAAMKDEEVPININYLKEMLEIIMDKNIIPVFVSTPVHKSYANKMDFSKVRMTNEIVNNLIRNYNIKHYNFMEDNRFAINDFFDPAHLNNIGAEKFTKILNVEVINSLLMEKKH